MKSRLKSLVLVGIPVLSLGLLVLVSAAQVRHHRVVVDVTGGKPEAWDGALNNVENLRKAIGPDIEIEVVGRGGGIGFLEAADAANKDRMKTLADGGVSFAACENTMKKKKIRKEDLLAFVTMVDSGAAEVIRKQEEGWSYLKTAD